MIVMTGIDHHAAPVGVRAVFTYRQQEMIDLMTKAREQTGAEGAVLLTTCNRTELYVSISGLSDTGVTSDADRSGGADAPDLTALLCRDKGLEPDAYRKYFTRLTDEAAISHLFALTSGLESAIVAEDQILTQVNEALVFARTHELTDSTLEVLFRKAVSAAKKVKSEVVFSYANRTAIDEALDQLRAEGFDPVGKKCMVIGNGAYGRMAAEVLMAQGADVTMTIRQYHSGMVLIPDGCRKILYGDKMQYFGQCDLVISATKSPNYTLFYDQVSACVPDHPMILIDFAVPHDIDPQIAQIEGIRVYTVDDFKTAGNPENEEALAEARQILREAQDEFTQRMNRAGLLPQISHIGDAAAADARFRLRKDIGRLHLAQEEKEALLARAGDVTGKITQKLLFRLRDELDDETLRRCIGILNEAALAEEGKYHAAEKH